MNRREFLNTMALQAALLSAAPKVYAQNSWGHDNWEGFFVTLLFSGAWDTSLSLNPWIDPTRPPESEYFLEYQDSELLSIGEHRLGPAMKIMAPHFQDISVVSGVFMSTNDNGHDSLLNYSMTGDVNNQRAAFNLELEWTLPSSHFSVVTDRPVPLGERSNNTTSVDDVVKALNGEDQGVAKGFVDRSSSELFEMLRQARSKKAQLEEAKNLLAKYQAQVNNSAYDKACVIAAALKAGLSRSAILTVPANLDTHSDHVVTHMVEQVKGWNFVNELFKLFKMIEYKDGKSLFDVTTFMVTSEFTRTPALNSSKGKDHNPWTNSYLLAGRGIKGQVVKGESRLVTQDHSQFGISYVTGLPFDFASGRAIRDSRASSIRDTIFPQHVLRTLTDAMGLNLKVMGGGLQKVSPIPGIVK